MCKTTILNRINTFPEIDLEVFTKPDVLLNTLFYKKSAHQKADFILKLFYYLILIATAIYKSQYYNRLILIINEVIGDIVFYKKTPYIISSQKFIFYKLTSFRSLAYFINLNFQLISKFRSCIRIPKSLSDILICSIDIVARIIFFVSVIKIPLPDF